jgi:hypothetical protein
VLRQAADGAAQDDCADLVGRYDDQARTLDARIVLQVGAYVVFDPSLGEHEVC